MKIKKKLGGGGMGPGGRVRGQGGCEGRIKVFVKIQKKKLGGGTGRVGVVRVGGFWVDVNEELKFWGKLKKNIFFFWGGGGSRWGLGRGGGGRGRGQGECDRRIEGFL